MRPAPDWAPPCEEIKTVTEIFLVFLFLWWTKHLTLRLQICVYESVCWYILQKHLLEFSNSDFIGVVFPTIYNILVLKHQWDILSLKNQYKKPRHSLVLLNTWKNTFQTQIRIHFIKRLLLLIKSTTVSTFSCLFTALFGPYSFYWPYYLLLFFFFRLWPKIHPKTTKHSK